MNGQSVFVCVVGLVLGACSSSGGGGAPPDGGAGSGGSSTGGTSASGGQSGSSGSGGQGATSGTGGVAGGAGVGGASGGAGGAPDAAEAAYGHECHAETDPCSDSLHSCVKFSLGAPGYDGFACSNTCDANGLDDCADSSATSPFNVGCVPFTSASRCMFVCKYQGQTWPCPTGMGCVEVGGSGLGYCLWT